LALNKINPKEHTPAQTKNPLYWTKNKLMKRTR
jgi:hypothetical protein